MRILQNAAFIEKVCHRSKLYCFAELMAENGRLPKMDGVTRAFATLMAAHRGEVVCEVTTAKVRVYGVIA
jgi:F0F1-type ATP synthase delta subunit